MLRLYLLGSLRAYLGDHAVLDVRFPRRKAKALLALLYLERGRYISRDELLEQLWGPDDGLSPETGRLKQTVLILRRALEQGRSRRTGWQYIVERDGSYFFNSQIPYSSDLELLEQELVSAHASQRGGDVEGALLHFHRAFVVRRGDLLPEFRYDDWATPHISAEREAYLEALEEAAQLHGSLAEYRRAIELLKRAVLTDPLRESSVFQLMAWLSRSGDSAEAVQVYLRFRDGLARRLQLEPDARTTELYHAIRRDRMLA
jgi:DNA-binding SARP family transcriptional activator